MLITPVHLVNEESLTHPHYTILTEDNRKLDMIDKYPPAEEVQEDWLSYCSIFA